MHRRKGLSYFKKMMPEFWTLRQVNREARRVVLQGRQVVHSRLVGAFGFIDWERDILHSGLPPAFQGNIQRIGFDLWHDVGSDFFYPAGIEISDFPYITLADLPALRSVYFTLDSMNYHFWVQESGSRYIHKELMEGPPPPCACSYALASTVTVMPLVRGDVAVCQRLLRRLDRFRNEQEHRIRQMCGRPIDCKIIVPNGGEVRLPHLR